MSKNISAPVPSKVVRQWFAENPAMVPEGDKSVGRTDHRGRLSPAAVAVAAENGLIYMEKVAEAKTITLPVTKTNSRGATLKRPVAVPLSEFRRLSGTHRGRPSAASLKAAAEAWASENQ